MTTIEAKVDRIEFDTAKRTLKRLTPEELEELVEYAKKKLLQSRIFEKKDAASEIKLYVGDADLSKINQKFYWIESEMRKLTTLVYRAMPIDDRMKQVLAATDAQIERNRTRTLARRERKALELAQQMNDQLNISKE